MSDFCVDYGMGIDGCEATWDPGDSSKAWVDEAVLGVVRPGYGGGEVHFEAGSLGVGTFLLETESRLRMLATALDELEANLASALQLGDRPQTVSPHTNNEMLEQEGGR